MKMKTITLVALILISVSTFGQSNDIKNNQNNIDEVYDYLETNKSELKAYDVKFAHHTKTKDTLYLQNDCDLSLYITGIWKTDESIVKKKPFIVLHSNIVELIKKEED